jgi:hypothetical protein
MISNYKINPELSLVNEPIEVIFKFNSDVEGEVDIETKIVVDIVYKKIEKFLLKQKCNLIKGTNDVSIRVNDLFKY